MIFRDDDEDTIAYPAPGSVRTPAETSTPAARRATTEMPLDRSSLLAEIDFDDPQPGRSSYREKTDEPESSKTNLKSAFREKTGEPTTSKQNFRTGFCEKTGEPMNT